MTRSEVIKHYESSSDGPECEEVVEYGPLDFRHDHRLMLSGKGFRCGTSFTVKAVLVGILSFLCFASIVMYGVWLLTKQMSYWGLFLTWAQLCVSLKCSLDLDIHSKPSQLRLHRYLLEMTLPLNLLVVLVYWSVLREPVVASCLGNQT